LSSWGAKRRRIYCPLLVACF